MAKKKKTRKDERRVLLGAIAVAAVITAGSTFAWFTSKDEVTNRLSASANYNVSIAEDFTPPEDWVPGQTIDKNVSVVNTGNTDAFVRAWLEGEMRLLAQGGSELDANTASTSLDVTAVDDAKLKELGFTYSNGDDDSLVYLKELDNTKKITNPDTQGQNSPPAYTEVMAVQAGGELAYTSGTSYKFTPNQAMSVTNNQGAIQHLAKDKEYIVTIDSTATTDIVVTTDTTNDTYTIILNSLAAFRNIDSNTFKPVSDGLYIFKRNADLETADDFEFSGYYVKTISDVQHFFALEYDTTGSQRSSNVLSDTAITYTVADDKSYTVDTTNVKLFAAKQETIDNSGLTWTLCKGVTKDGVTYTTSDNGTTWYKGTTALNSTDDAALITTLNALTKVDMFQVKRNSGAGAGVLINIALDNLGSGTGNAEKWTAITDTDKTTTFYYNNDLEEGATTSKLVDSLTMDSTVTQNDYIAFDFDLNVFMESVQVTIAENGDEGFDSVTPWAVASTATYSDATGAAGTVTNGEIELIAWSNS